METIFPIRVSKNLLSNGMIILPISVVSFLIAIYEVIRPTATKRKASIATPKYACSPNMPKYCHASLPEANPAPITAPMNINPIDIKLMKVLLHL